MVRGNRGQTERSPRHSSVPIKNKGALPFLLSLLPTASVISCFSRQIAAGKNAGARFAPNRWLTTGSRAATVESSPPRAVVGRVPKRPRVAPGGARRQRFSTVYPATNFAFLQKTNKLLAIINAVVLLFLSSGNRVFDLGDPYRKRAVCIGRANLYRIAKELRRALPSRCDS